MIAKNNKILVLDQGPIYMLGRLRGFGAEVLKSQRAREMVEQ